MRQDLIPSTTRIEFFSDAVMAIIMTLLVLEISVPALGESFTSSQAIEALGHLMPKFVSFAMSFLVIAIVWVNHHHFFERLEHADRALLWHNNAMLFWLCFIPFPTAFVGEHMFSPVPVMLYGFVMFMVALSFAWMHYHAYRKELFFKNVSRRFLRQENFRSLAAPFLYALSMLIAWYSVSGALIVFLLVPVLYFLPMSSVKEV